MTTNNNGSNGITGTNGIVTRPATGVTGGLAGPGLAAPRQTGLPAMPPRAVPVVAPAPVAAAPVAAAQPSELEALKAELARLQQANAVLTTKVGHRPTGGGISFLVKSQVKDQTTGEMVASKGTIGVYGVNAKFPMSLYPITMEKFIAAILAGDLVEAMRLNPEALAFRDAKDNQVTDRGERRRLALECADRIEAMCKGAAGKAGIAK